MPHLRFSRRLLVALGLVLALAGCKHTYLIAFQSNSSGKYEIYTIHPDGTMLTQVTHGPLENEQPALNRGATRIAYVARQLPNISGLHWAYTTGSADTKISTPGLSHASGGRWSPNDENIAFSAIASDELHPDIFVINWDGTNLRRLTDLDNNIEPSYSPDGGKILFTSTRDGDSNIYVMNVDGSDQKRLTNDPAADAQASFSPDGTKIAFWSSRTGNGDIYLMDADGNNQVPLVTSPVLEFEPQFAPDTSEIVYAVGSTTRDLYVINVDTKVVRRLTNSPYVNRAPDWK